MYRRHPELPDVDVIDVDTHLSEPHDLWTSRAPARFVDRVPHVEQVDGLPTWVVDDGVLLGRALAAAVIRPDGSKVLGARGLFTMELDDVHPAASQVAPRLEVMDEMGIWAQVVYPNAVGFGGQGFGKIKDVELRNLCATIWNDAMAELQEESGGRLCPMGIIPWWDLDASVKEVERMHERGLHGVNTNADPQNQGLPDLSDAAWDPLWDAMCQYELPLNFHIGGSVSQASFAGNAKWPSFNEDEGLALGSAMLYVGNARVIANLLYSGVLERHPTLKVVSVESGIGWIPFMLEALDHQLTETAPHLLGERLTMMPSEYFARQMYACFWFESRNLVPAIERLGTGNCLFETDFPHPTCLYPDSLHRAAEHLADGDATLRRRVMSDNAAAVYRIERPGDA
jgi:predicted TIM-barrel fold metal-dependent hydrolase